MLLDENYHADLEPSLGSGEKLIWTGKPKSGIVFRSSDFFLIPFSLLWLLIALSIINVSNFPRISSIMFLPFLVIGMYITVGRFFLDAKIRASTTYGLTKDRIIISRGIFKKSISSMHIKGLSEITLKKSALNTGTILLGPSNFSSFLYEGLPWPGKRVSSRLELINNAKEVYEKILEIQRQ